MLLSENRIVLVYPRLTSVRVVTQFSLATVFALLNKPNLIQNLLKMFCVSTFLKYFTLRQINVFLNEMFSVGNGYPANLKQAVFPSRVALKTAMKRLFFQHH